MAARTKKIPKYMLAVVEKKEDLPNDGNEQKSLNHQVWKIDGSDNLLYDDNGNPDRSFVSENYTFNGQHRQFALSEKGVWKIDKDAELNIFKRMRWCGHYINWKEDTYKGWGINLLPNVTTILPGQTFEVQNLGKGLDNEDLKICKFVEGNKGDWHGYPINYTLKNQEYIPERIIDSWWKELKVIDKSDYNDIRTKQESSLS